MRCISNFIAEHQADEAEEEEEEKPKKKKTRKRKRKEEKETAAAPPVKKVVKCRIKVAEGMEAPKKGIKEGIEAELLFSARHTF